MPTAIGTAMAIAMTELTTVPYASTATPKTGGFALAFHSKVVRKLPWSLEIAFTARTVRKTAIAAMTTRSTMPEPRDRPAKIRSPGRVTVDVSAGGGVEVGGGAVVVIKVSGLGGGARAPP